MHDRIRLSHYPDGFGKMPRERNIAWDYDQWIDPGFRREDELIAPVGTYPIPSKDCAHG